MTKSEIFSLSLLILACYTLLGCREIKEDIPVEDMVAPYLGEYAGIRIYTQYVGQTRSYHHDTSAITATISYSLIDSIVNVDLHLGYPSSPFSFTYANDTFISITPYYHPPIMSLRNGHFEIYHKPALAPFWYRYIGDKIQ